MPSIAPPSNWQPNPANDQRLQQIQRDVQRAQQSIQQRWPEIQAFAQNWLQQHPGINPRVPQQAQLMAYNQALAQYGIQLPKDYKINPSNGTIYHESLSDNVQHAAEIGVGVGTAMLAGPAILGGGAGAGGGAAAGYAGPSAASEIAGVDAAAGGGGLAAAGGAASTAAATKNQWWKGLAKLAPAAVGLATIPKSTVADPKDQIAKLFEAFPQLRTLLDNQMRNANQSQPLNEAVKQMALNLLPNSSRNAYPGVPNIREIK